MKDQKYQILLVDDEEDILEFLSYNLKKNNYEVYTASNGDDGIKKALEIKPDLIILDVMMPKMDGIETCENLRKFDELNNPFIVFLTARSEDYSQIAGFDVGADDYITKPIKPKVLVSKINAILKRKSLSNNSNANEKKILVVEKDFIIDQEKYLVIKDNKNISLPKKEFELLYLFASKKGVVFTREEIFSKVWGNQVIVGDRTIDVHIRKIREKIGAEYIQTIKGIGYKFISKEQ